MRKSEQTDNSITQRRKPEALYYCVYIYDVTGPDHVERILRNLNSPMPVFYGPESGKLAISFDTSEHDRMYRLAMNFMRGLIPGYQSFRVYRSKRKTHICSYGREDNGRRYRWFSGNKKTYIDPEPQPAEDLHAA